MWISQEVPDEPHEPVGLSVLSSAAGRFVAFRKDIDPSWVEDALRSTGTATIRKRRLPATQVIWLMIGLALFRNRSLTEVASSLDLALPTPERGCLLAVQTSGRMPVRPGIVGGTLRCTPSTE